MKNQIMLNKNLCLGICSQKGKSHLKEILEKESKKYDEFKDKK